MACSIVVDEALSTDASVIDAFSVRDSVTGCATLVATATILVNSITRRVCNRNPELTISISCPMSGYTSYSLYTDIQFLGVFSASRVSVSEICVRRRYGVANL